MNVAEQSYITSSGGAGIAADIETAIREGRLAPGEHLPTVRDLAARLGVSPTTVATVYRDLRRRGLVTGAGRRGTTVSPRPAVACRARPAIPAGVRDLASGNPDTTLLPPLAPAAARIDLEHAAYGADTADPSLLALARQRLVADGIPAAHLTVVGGALDGVERVLQANLSPGDRVAVEDPGYAGILDLLAALGLVPRPVPVDDAGMDPDRLDRALADGAAAVVVTPRAQNPCGAALDRDRAAALRAVVARHPHTLVIEDDHAAEIAGVPAATLCDGDGMRWAVLRSVSKTLGPDLRLAVLSGDAATVARVEGRRTLGTGWVSHLLQRLVVALWSDPATDAVLARAAAAYRDRRIRLLEALAVRGIGAHGRSGFNIWVPVEHEDTTTAALLETGWAVLAGERFRIAAARGIRISAATLSPAEAPRLAEDLAAALRRAPARLA